MQIVRRIKEECCHVALDYDSHIEECKSSAVHDKEYTLPNLEKIVIPGLVRAKGPELLFKPHLNGKACESMPDLVWSSIQDCEIEVRPDLTKNIIMSGGSTMFEGIPDRLHQEIKQRAPAGSDVRVTAANDRKFAVWKGASTLANLETFSPNWVTREEYEEYGSAIVLRKCA